MFFLIYSRAKLLFYVGPIDYSQWVFDSVEVKGLLPSLCGIGGNICVRINWSAHDQYCAIAVVYTRKFNVVQNLLSLVFLFSQDHF